MHASIRQIAHREAREEQYNLRDAYLIGKEAPVNDILTEGRLTAQTLSDCLDDLVKDTCTPTRTQEALLRMLINTRELHERAGRVDGRMDQALVRTAQLDAVVDGKTALQKAIACENYELAGAIKSAEKSKVASIPIR